MGPLPSIELALTLLMHNLCLEGVTFGVTFGTLFQTPRDMVNADKRPLAFQCVARRVLFWAQKRVNSLAYTKSDHFLGGVPKSA